MPLSPLVTIAGTMTGHDGVTVTSGRLTITPTKFLLVGGLFVAPVPFAYDIPGSGAISFALTPSQGVRYTVVFDPDPADQTPLPLKTGYFKQTWLVPGVGPVDISDYAALDVETAGPIFAGVVGPALLLPTPGLPTFPTKPSGQDFNVAIITGAAITNYYITKDVTAGKITLDGAAILSVAQFSSPKTITFKAKFSGDAFQHVGFAVDLATTGDRAIISTFDTTGIFARTNVFGSAVETRTLMATTAEYGVEHEFQISWDTTSVQYFMDGTLLATHTASITNPQYVVASDANQNASRLVVTGLAELL